MSCRLARLAAAVLLTAAASVAVLGVAAAPAPAAGCSGSAGVTVVVDFKALGGGVQEACDPSGAGVDAATLFSRDGFSLTYVQRQPGFVCRIDDVPASDPCVNTPPTDAYWGLFWSDGTSGSWDYASQGAGSLTVSDGGYVAFAWQGSSDLSAPGVAPAPHSTSTPTQTSAPTPSPTHSPKASPTHSSGAGSGHHQGSSPSASPAHHPTSSPSASAATPAGSTAVPTPTSATTPTSGSSSGTATAGVPTTTPAASQSSRPSPTGSGEATSTSAATSGTGDPTEPTASSQDSGALPTWLVLLVVAGLGILAAGVAVVRSRRTRGADDR